MRAPLLFSSLADALLVARYRQVAFRALQELAR